MPAGCCSGDGRCGGGGGGSGGVGGGGGGGLNILFFFYSDAAPNYKHILNLHRSPLLYLEPC